MKMRLWVAIVVTLAALIRLPSFLHDGIWRDEAYVYIDVTASTFGEFFHRVTETEWHPPLYFLLAYAWSHVAGTSALALTMLPYAFSVATTALVYLLGTAAASRKVGLLAASIYALAPLPIEYSTEYVYPLTGALAALLAWLVTRARREVPSTHALLAVAAVSILTAFSHYVALIFIVLLGGWSLLGRPNPRQAMMLVSALAAGPLAFLFWLPVFLAQRRIGVPFQFPIVPLLKAWFFAKWLLEFMPGRPFQAECALLLLLVVAVVMIVRRGVWRNDAAALGLMFVAMLFFTTAAGLPYERYAVPYCGLLYVAIAWSAFALFDLFAREDPAAWQRFGKFVPVVLAAVFAAGDIAYAFQNASVPKSGIATFASSGLDRSTLYVIAPDYMAATFAFYTRDHPVAYRGFVRVDDPQIFRVEGYARDWTDPHVVERAIATIERDALFFKYVTVVADERALTAQNPYRQTRRLLRRLETRYRLLSESRYPGRFEPVAVFRFVIE
ncbi:MAG TPA: hypothetical protein VFE36_01175 [Candidatus Baltobacteraceae bacterium]|nr:hypothetical protein [Candidatus Baltobacteraceae bacterium]